jgi:PAS domain S-box-containing protein
MHKFLVNTFDPHVSDFLTKEAVRDSKKIDRLLATVIVLQCAAVIAIPWLTSTSLALDWQSASYLGCVVIQGLLLAIIHRLTRRKLTRDALHLTQLETNHEQSKAAIADATQELMAANGFLSGIIEAQAGEIAILDDKGVIRHSNQAWDVHWSNNELQATDCCDQNCIEICDLSFGSQNGVHTVSSSIIQRVLSGESQFESITYGCVLAGEERWFQIEITPFFSGSIHAVVIQREITAQYVSEQSLQDARRWGDRLASAVSNTHNGIIFTDRSRKITWVNEGFEKITGYTMAEVVGKSPGKLLQCASTDPQTVREMRDAMDRRVPFQGKIKNVSKHGREYWLDLDIHPLFDADGQLDGFMAVESEVTELVEALHSAENALHEVSTLRNALDHHSLLSVTDADGTITDVNSGFCSLSGYRRDELLGKNHRILNSGYHPRSFWKKMWSKVSSGTAWRGEIKNRAKDGNYYWVDATIIPQMGPDGVPEKLISLRFDITDTKRVEESLEVANQQYRLLASAVERSPDISVVTDLDGIVLYANPAAYRLDAEFGYDLELGAPALMFAVDGFDPADLNRLVDTVRNGKVFSKNFEILPDSTGRLLEFSSQQEAQPQKVLSVTASPLENSQGEVDGILLVKRDITEETARQRSLQEINTAMDAANDCVFMFDADTLRFVYANQGAIKQIGYQMDDLRSMTPSDIKPHFSSDEFNEFIQQFHESPGKSVVFRTEHQHREGQRIPVEISLQLVPSLGRNGRFIAIVRDITEQIRTETDLEAAREQAETSNRVKSDFLANMSHEIRTPMTAIIGFADLLDSEDEIRSDTALMANAVQTIRSNANHLLTIINDILDMSKIEAGRMTVERIEMNPVEIITDVIDLLRPRANDKGVEVQVAFESELPTKIQSDPTRLRQVLVNLIGNAIKFTKAGSVTLRVCLEPTAEKLRFTVVDTGVGMTAEQCDVIRRFESFTQADSSTQREFGGTGLGLRISNSFAELLGDKLTVESTRNVGSSFSFAVSTGDLSGVERVHPSQAAGDPSSIEGDRELQADRIAETAPLNGVHVLLAEDGPDNQRLISFFLGKAGARVTLADNGRIAAELVESGEQDFDVILMDMQMPELDGYEATRRLRTGGHRCPIIALTAHAMVGDRRKCMDAGCDDYATKPIQQESLIRAVKQHALSHQARNQQSVAPLCMTDGQHPLPSQPASLPIR